MQKGTPIRTISSINSKTRFIKTPTHQDSGRHALEGRKFGNVKYTNLRTTIKAMPVNAAQRVSG